MVIDVLQHVPHAYTYEDGSVIGHLITRELRQLRNVAVSFDGIDAIPSSFVNAAFVALLDEFDFGVVREHLTILHSTRQINTIIRERMQAKVASRSRAA